VPAHRRRPTVPGSRTSPGARRALAARGVVGTAAAAVAASLAASAVLVQQPPASARSLDAAGAPSGTEAECLDAGEVQLLALINSYRTAHGLAALAPSRRLDVSAYRHSEDQADNRYFGVARPDGGGSPADRAREQG
jgi:uncharacterized protein YkwD